MAQESLISIADVLRRVGADLEAVGARHVLVGGLAVSARTEPRFTRAIDLAIAVASDEQAERLLADLQQRGWVVTRMLEQDAVGRLASARVVHPPASGVVVDLLFASSGVEAEVVAAASTLEVLEGLFVPVASLGDLLAMKVLSRDDERRPQDLVDLRALLGAAAAADVDLARDRARLIEQRGYARGRNLRQAIEDLAARRR